MTFTWEQFTGVLDLSLKHAIAGNAFKFATTYSRMDQWQMKRYIKQIPSAAQWEVRCGYAANSFVT